MPKSKKDFNLLQKIQEVSECDLIPEDIEPPSKKLKTAKDTGKKTTKTTSKITTATSLHFRYGKSTKTSVLARLTPLKNILSPKSMHAFQEELKKNEGYTPVKEVIQISARGTPQVVKSAHNTLYFQSKNGLFYNFSKTKTAVKKVALDPDLTATKKVSVIVSEELLQLVAKKILENKGRRCKTQNKVMGGSATELTHAAGLSLKNKSEWGHLVAHRFLSDLSQHQKNLAAITDHANTEMIPIEDFVATLALKKLGKIKIVVTANIIKKTEIASSIDYAVHVGGRIFKFSFDGQQLNKPDIANKKSDGSILQSVISA